MRCQKRQPSWPPFYMHPRVNWDPIPSFEVALGAFPHSLAQILHRGCFSIRLIGSHGAFPSGEQVWSGFPQGQSQVHLRHIGGGKT